VLVLADNSVFVAAFVAKISGFHFCTCEVGSTVTCQTEFNFKTQRKEDVRQMNVDVIGNLEISMQDCTSFFDPAIDMFRMGETTFMREGERERSKENWSYPQISLLLVLRSIFHRSVQYNGR
jgi:hypothetical protein